LRPYPKNIRFWLDRKVKANLKAICVKRDYRLAISVSGSADEQAREAVKKNRAFLKLASYLLIGVTSICWSGCNKQSTDRAALPPPPVTVAKPVTKEIVEWDEYTGRTDAVQSVNITARVSGYLYNITFKAGEIVMQNDLLFVIDPRPYQAAYDQADGQLRQAEAQQKLNNLNLARADELRAKNVIAKQDYDNAVSQKSVSDAQVVAAQAALEAAQLNLGFTDIKAPVTGRIGREQVTIGNLVQADSTLLTTLVSVDPIYAYFNVDERSVLKYRELVREGKLAEPMNFAVPVYLQLENEKGFPHQGTIDFINNQFDPSTGTLQIRGIFPNANGFLVPGSFVRVRVAGSPRYPAILVTDRAIGSDQGQKFALIVGINNTVELRPLELGPVVDGLRVVRKGLTGNENVIINGLVNARPGSKVNPQQGDMNQFTTSQLELQKSVVVEPAGAGKEKPVGSPAQPGQSPSQGNQSSGAKREGG
jgi:RND family efflux transporter MFP subunit